MIILLGVALTASVFISGVIMMLSRLYSDCYRQRYANDEESPLSIPLFPAGWLGNSLQYLKVSAKSDSQRLIGIFIITGIITVITCWLKQDNVPQMLLGLICGYILLTLSVVDLETEFLPDSLTLILAVLGIVQSLWEIFIPLKESLIGSVGGYGILWVVTFLYGIIRKKQGMGGGDFKLLAAMGAWGGVNLVLVTFILAPFIGIMAVIAVAIKNRSSLLPRIPFGPALSLAGFSALLYGHEMVAAYLSLITR